MKHVCTKETLESINHYAERHNGLSSKEIMVGYMKEFAGKTEDAAVETADKLINGVSSFKDLYSASISKGLNSKEIGNKLSARLLSKVSELSEDDANRLLFNLYNELNVQSRDNLAALAGTLGDSNMAESIKNLKETSKGKFEGLTREEKVRLIADAVETCGTVSGLMSVAECERALTIVPRKKMINDTLESAYSDSSSDQVIRNTFEDIINMNYTALAAYIDREKTGADKGTTTEMLGAMAASSYERSKIQRARINNFLSIETVAHLFGIIAQVLVGALLLLISALLLQLFAGILFLSDIGGLWTGLLFFGAVGIVGGGASRAIDDTALIREGTESLIIRLKKLIEKLFSRLGKPVTNQDDADNKAENGQEKSENTEEETETMHSVETLNA